MIFRYESAYVILIKALAFVKTAPKVHDPVGVEYL
jgi:hypothetical protein